MSFSIYDASIPLLVRMLANLSQLLQKASDHAEVGRADPAALIEARLAPDMFTLGRQVQSACDAAKACAARLAGMKPPSFPDTETSFPELQARIATTIAFIRGIEPEQIQGAEDRTITIQSGKQPMVFEGRDYLTQFAIPNFLFHVTIAYAILRQQGVEIGKLDYLGGS